MATETVILSTSDMCRKKWPTTLATTMEKYQFFNRFIGTADGSIIQKKIDLQKSAGDSVKMEILNPIDGDAAEGGVKIENDNRYETELDFGTDVVNIDYRRKTVKKHGTMTDQRTPWDLQKKAKTSLSRYFGEDTDEILMIYLAGARGVNPNFKVPLTFTGRANNALQAPDSAHIYYADGLAKASITTDAKMDIDEIEKMAPRARLLTPQIQPYKTEKDGKGKFILLMAEEQAYDLRRSTSDGDWLDIVKRKSNNAMIEDGALGTFNNCVLHAHSNVIKFSDYGSGGTLAAARALLLGASAGAIAWGQAGGAGKRFKWNEETYDRGEGLAVTAGHSWGCTKVRYIDESDGTTTTGDFGVIALDTYYTALTT